MPDPPHVRALSERAGKVYAATDNFSEGYAAGVSSDEGSTWSPLLAYQDVRAITPCLKAACQTSCDAEVQLALWSLDICSADPPPISGAGGRAAGGAGETGHLATGGAPAGGQPRTGTTGGCGCGIASAGSPVAPVEVGLALVALAAGARRARRRRDNLAERGLGIG